MSIKRIYCNSTTQKQQGDDTSFILQLGQLYTFKKIQLDFASIQNLFPNFYSTNPVDYSDFTISVNGVVYAFSNNYFIPDIPTMQDWLTARLKLFNPNLDSVITLLNNWSNTLTL